MINPCKSILKATIGYFLILYSTFLPLHAIDQQWNGSISPSVFDLNNWTPNGVPGDAERAIFNDLGQAQNNPTADTGGTFAPEAILFSGLTTPYTFTISASSSLSPSSSSGITNTSGLTQTIELILGANLNFVANAQTGSMMHYDLSDSSVTFAGSATGSGDFTLAAVSNFTTNGDVTIGSLSTDGACTISLGGALTFGNSLNTTIASIIADGSSRGSIIKYGTGTVILSAANTYSGGTTIGDSNNLGGELVLTGAGRLSSRGDVAVNNGTFDYSGITGTSNISIGNLSGNTANGVIIPGAINLTINQALDTSYEGVIDPLGVATGTITKTGDGILNLTGNSSSYTGSTVINARILNVNGQLGGDISTVDTSDFSLLTGTGTVSSLGRTTTIGTNTAIFPGNISEINFIEPGILTAAGDVILQDGSEFILLQNGTVSSLLKVNQDITINGDQAIVVIGTFNGIMNFNQKEAFITSTGTLTGKFNPNINVSDLLFQFNSDFYAVGLSYDAHNAYFTLQTTLEHAAFVGGANQNELTIAHQLDSIDPTALQEVLLSNFVALPTTDALIEALNESTGAQYSTLIFAGEVANRQFLRRLFEPIREIVLNDLYQECCMPTNPCCEFLGCDLWASAGGGQSKITGNYGFTSNEWDITLGLQRTVCQNITYGLACSYEYNTIDYHLNGNGKTYSGFAGIYALYRPSCYYVLADLTYGYSRGKLNRSVTLDTVIDELKSKPRFSQVTFYAEAGYDAHRGSFCFQPFFGIEVAGFDRKSIKESEVTPSDLGLFIHTKKRTIATSRLGIRLPNQYCVGLKIDLDLAWLYRFSEKHNFTANFQTFGSDFDIDGIRIGHNSAECVLSISKDLCHNWRAFLEGSGEVWDHAATYNVVAGIQATW